MMLAQGCTTLRTRVARSFSAIRTACNSMRTHTVSALVMTYDTAVCGNTNDVSAEVEEDMNVQHSANDEGTAVELKRMSFIDISDDKIGTISELDEENVCLIDCLRKLNEKKMDTEDLKTSAVNQLQSYLQKMKDGRLVYLATKMWNYTDDRDWFSKAIGKTCSVFFGGDHMLTSQKAWLDVCDVKLTYEMRQLRQELRNKKAQISALKAELSESESSSELNTTPVRPTRRHTEAHVRFSPVHVRLTKSLIY